MTQNRLSKLFRRSVQGLCLLTAVSYGVIRNTGRPLTSEEKDLMAEVFGDEIKTDAVRLHFAPKKPFKKDGITFFNDVLIYNKYGSDNYGNSDDTIFPHEMTHILQYQNRSLFTHFCTTYEYSLTPQSNFDNFCIEQQAAMVANYVLRIVCPGDKCQEDTDGQNNLLIKVVESRFPHAQNTRLEREGRLARGASPPAL